VVVAVITAVASAATLGVESVERHWLALVIAVAVIAGARVVLAVARWRRQRRVARFMEAARSAASTPTLTQYLAEVTRLRIAAGSLPEAATTELEGLYRTALAEVLADRQVTEGERIRLDDLKGALGLQAEATTRAEVEGFLQAYTAFVADRWLTAEEESALERMRQTLRIPDEAVQAQLAFAGSLRDQRVALEAQLRKAKDVTTGTLSPIDAGVKMRDGEVCFFQAPFTEKKGRVTRTYVVDGVRRKETGLESVRSGNVYVTSERVLLVADGATTIKLEKILDAAVDSESNVLALTVDGRKTPYYLEVPEPFVAAAYIDKATATA
jgi:hypothetical protein